MAAENKRKQELVQGTLDMLILKTIGDGKMHGYSIARGIQRASDDFLRVEEGSLYPALHRMERRGWLEAEWGRSEAKRRAKYYRLTETGHAQLLQQVEAWDRLVEAIGSVMQPRGAET